MEHDDEGYEVALLRGEVERAAAVLDRLGRVYGSSDIDPSLHVDLEQVRSALERASVEADSSARRWRESHS